MGRASKLAELAGSYGTGGFVGMKNRIINGLMTINQRALTGPTSGYFVDRWQVGGVSSTALQTSGLPAGYTQAISIYRNVAGAAYALQNIESKNIVDCVNQQVTVSLLGKNVSGISSITVELSYANSSDNFGSVTPIQTVTASASPSGAWAPYYAVFNALPANAANGLQVKVNAVTASGGTLELTGVQLEKGSTATPFEFRQYGTELALCQRYLPAFLAGSNSFFGSALSSTQQYVSVNFPVQTRVAPTGLSISSASHFTVGDYISAAGPCTSMSLSIAGINNASVIANIASGLTQARPGNMLANTASAVLLFTGCEL